MLVITAVNTTVPLVSISFANPYDAQKNITIQQIFEILNVTPGFVVDNLANTVAPLGAIALVEGDYTLTPDIANNVKIFTSVLWAVFRPLAYVLEQAKGDIDVAIQQLGFVTAQGDFLDYWGTFFGIPRYSTFSSQVTTSLTASVNSGNNVILQVGNTLGIQTGNYILVGTGTKNAERALVVSVPSASTIIARLALSHDVGDNIAVENGVRTIEPDYEYSVRLLWETIKPRLNNKAIEELLFRGTGYETIVTDLSSKILLADGYSTPVDKSANLQFSDDTMVSDGFLTSTSQGFPEDDVRYGLGERYNFGSIGVFVDIPIENAFYPYTLDQIQDIVERHRAGGTTPWFIANQVAKETLNLVSEVVVQLQADVEQDIDEGRAMLFGYDDFQFYADHTSPASVAKMPWLQSNLDKPSLSDNVVLQSKQVTIPAQYVSNNESIFISGPLADGFLGCHSRNLLIADTNSTGDEFRFRIINSQTLVTPETTQFIDEPVLLNYQRLSDEYITPRVLEGFTDDVFTKSASTIGTFNISSIVRTNGVVTATIGVHGFIVGQNVVVSGVTNTTFNSVTTFNLTAVATTTVSWNDSQSNATSSGGTVSSDNSALNGLGDLTNVALSSDLTFTTPLIVSAPTSITGVKFDAIALTQANIRSTPLVIRNLEIPDFGDNWNTNYSANRVWIVPLQDVNGNVYYMNISWPFETTPVVPALRISNPTSSITSDKFQIQSGDIINVTWAATNSNGVVILRRETVATGVISDLPVSPSGTAQFSGGSAVTQNTRFHLIVNGNNGQTAESICTITVVVARTNAMPPTITMAATPDVVELCDSNTTIINYTVVFNSIQTETQTVAFAANAASVNVSPLVGDPVGTTILAPKEVTPGNFEPRQITVSRSSDGLPVPGAWSNLETVAATFIPADPSLVQGNGIVVTYDVNYGGSFLKFQGTTVPLPNGGNVFSISQTINVTLPPPPSASSPVLKYVANYSVTADNYATIPVTTTLPVYIQTVEQGPGPFQVKTISPTAITEAIGPTINQTIPITLTGTGFSSKMQVFLANQVPSSTDPTLFIPQLVQADIMSVDWQNGILIFIAPRFTFNTAGYPVLVNNLDCLGNVLSTDSSRVLIYNRSDFRDAPIIDTITPTTVCLVPGFVSKRIELTGKFFRPGAQVFVVTSTGPVSQATTVVNLNDLFFTMTQTVAGSYDIIVENADTSSGATKGQPLLLMANNTIPTIDDYGYVAPKSTQGCAYYGVPFTLHWSCSKTSSVSFLSSDSAVQAALQPPPSSLWPPVGTVSVPISTEGTTITMVALNDCNNTASATVTINDLACDRTLAIDIVPNPITINNLLAYKLHTHRTSFNESTKITSDVDISDDPALTYSLVDANDNSLEAVIAIQGVASQAITLVNRYITANSNGIARVKAFWNGFQDTAPVYVQVPVPISLSVTPNPISFSNIGEVFQLIVTATYSDGTVKVVTTNPNTRYYDYDVKVCSVSLTGGIVTNSLGNTYVHCSYFDSFDSSVIVYTTAQIGQPDDCVGFERLFMQPSYAVAGNLIPTPINFAVIGANPVTNNVMPDSSGNLNFSYQGVSAGNDVITASSFLPALTSNPVTVTWVNPIAAVSCANVVGLFYTSDGTGVFSSNGQNPVFSQNFTSLSFNDTALGESDIIPGAVVNAVLDNNGNKTGNVTVAGAGFIAGEGTIAAFNAVIIGNFIVKSADSYAFAVTSDDGIIMGVGGGATRVGGSWIGVPASQKTVYSQLPIVGASNQGQGPLTVPIVVNFPAPGIYPFEFNWANGLATGGTTTFTVWLNGAPVLPITLPAPPVNTIPAPAYGILTLKPTNNGIFITGGNATFTGTAMGVNEKAGQFTLNVVGDNVRSAIVNGVSVLSGGEIQPLWQYESNQLTNTSKTFEVTITNNSGTVTAMAAANLITFPNAVIHKFTGYDGSNVGSPEVSNFFTLNYGAPVGLCWNTSNAVSVTLSASNVLTGDVIIEHLPGSGSRYEVPLLDTVYTLRVFSTDGSSIIAQIGVTVANYKYFTHDWSFGPWYAPGNYWRLWPGHVFASESVNIVRIGQTSTISLPAWDQTYVFSFWDEYLNPIGGWPAFGPGSFDDRAWSRYTALNELADGSISKDGTRPTVQAPVVAYQQNSSGTDSFTVSPSTNTIYQFNLTGWWFWWFWDNWDFARLPNIAFLNGSFQVPFVRSSREIWNYSFHGAVNVDPGPSFTSLSVSSSSINAGDAITVTYTATGASSITANFAQNEEFPINGGSFTIFPDKTTDFVLVATSPTGLTINGTVHVDVTPQVYYAPCLIMPMPRVDSIAIDGLSSASNALFIKEDEGVHVIEIFGDHFLGDRVSTPEIVGTVKVVLTHQSGAAATALDIVELSAVANQYIRLKVDTHNQTLAGIYTVFVMNDVGISNEKGPTRSFTVKVSIPEFIMNKPVSAYPGNTVTLFIDEYDAIKDAGLTILVGNTAVTPTSIGATLSDNDFITQMYQQILGRVPDTVGLNFWLGVLSSGENDRFEVMNGFLTSAEYLNSGRNVSVLAGTALTVPIGATSAVAIGLRTNNGISQTQIEFIPMAQAPAPPVTISSCPVITGVTPTSGTTGTQITVFGTNFTTNSKLFLGGGVTKPIITSFINSTTLQFVVPAFVGTTIASITLQDGTCSDTYNGFMAVGLDVTIGGDGAAPVRTSSGIPLSGPGSLVFGSSKLGVSNPVLLNATSTPPTTTASSIGIAATQPTVTVTSSNSATVTTTAVNNVPVKSVSDAQVSTVSYVDVASSTLQLQ